jgi:hypothetical protein
MIKVTGLTEKATASSVPSSVISFGSVVREVMTDPAIDIFQYADDWRCICCGATGGILVCDNCAARWGLIW